MAAIETVLFKIFDDRNRPLLKAAVSFGETPVSFGVNARTKTCKQRKHNYRQGDWFNFVLSMSKATIS